MTSPGLTGLVVDRYVGHLYTKDRGLQLTYFGPLLLPEHRPPTNNSPVSSFLRYPFKLFPCVSSTLNILFKLRSPGVPWSPSLLLTLGVPVQGLTANATWWFA